MSRDIHFVFVGHGERVLQPGQWAWLEYENKLIPVSLCPECGEFTRWNVKITAQGWVCGPIGCSGRRKNCSTDRVRFLGWHTPPS
jgi:hypothetical protein